MKRPVSPEGLSQAFLAVFGLFAVVAGIREGGSQGRLLLGIAAVIFAAVAMTQYRTSKREPAPATDRFSLPWWLGTVVPGAFFTWASFAYVGIRGRRPKWFCMGVAYLAAFVGVFAVAEHNGPFGGLLLAGVWLYGIGHAMAIDAEVVARLQARDRNS